MIINKKSAKQVALVTGGARGIGKAYCEGFVSEGVSVVVADINYKRAQETASELEKIGGQALAVEVDVASEKSVKKMFENILSYFERVDFLVNNAAIMLDVEKPFKPFWELEEIEWNRVMSVNSAGVYLCCKYVKPIMEKIGGGKIVNITSDAIWKGYEGQLAYFASKGAVAVMTRCLARELGKFNINVNAIAPGLTISEAVESSEFMMETIKPIVTEACAIQKEQTPEDLVGTMLFLCSSKSDRITGQTIVVNRGVVMP
ncbi:SDR family NAD(P)-dependent oxidoreductase [Moorena bouillonii]|uniref:SDR family NAD(P)-dependent oxidoreductase n=1 Tax=Moorena bouillonii TaxID=207920 RepID=UPI0013012F4F|nr:SDR family oxidoreductase [Moorena bouillonii]